MVVNASTAQKDIAWMEKVRLERGCAVTLAPRALRGVLASLALVMLVASLDSTAVGTALPRIVTDLHGNDLYAWVFTIYLLTMTVSMTMYAAISDRVGRRPVLFFGVALFLLASALCGLSTEMWQLVLFRGIQGLGAGALAPVVVAIVGDLFSPADRARYQPLLGSVFLFAFLVGPTVRGPGNPGTARRTACRDGCCRAR